LVFEDLNSSHSQRYGLSFKAAVEEGLPAADLLGWEYDVTTGSP
jgi:hypothetical protein